MTDRLADRLSHWEVLLPIKELRIGVIGALTKFAVVYRNKR